MSRMRRISPRSLLTVDPQVAGWMARARTPQTRARIRWWAWAETLGVLVMIPGIVMISVSPFVLVGIVIWFAIARIDRVDVYWWYGGVTIGLLTVGAALSMIATDKRRAACFADGHVSVGRVDEVVEYPGGGDEHTWYQVIFSAELQDGVILRRKLYWGEDGYEAKAIAGRRILFRHNTLDPMDLQDCLYDGPFEG